MKPGLKIGDFGELTWIVDPTMTITLGGLPQATVFATPSMIMLMELAAREVLRPFRSNELPPGCKWARPVISIFSCIATENKYDNIKNRPPYGQHYHW